MKITLKEILTDKTVEFDSKDYSIFIGNETRYPLRIEVFEDKILLMGLHGRLEIYPEAANTVYIKSIKFGEVV